MAQLQLKTLKEKNRKNNIIQFSFTCLLWTCLREKICMRLGKIFWISTGLWGLY